MKTDIRHRDDVYLLVKSFYEVLINDEFIGDYFTKVVQLDFEVHLPRISEFWISVLFGKGQYQGNPILRHIDLHNKKALGQAEFDRWLGIWANTIDSLFVGPVSEMAKQKAGTMAQLMLIKIEASGKDGFIQ